MPGIPCHFVLDPSLLPVVQISRPRQARPTTTTAFPRLPPQRNFIQFGVLYRTGIVCSYLDKIQPASKPPYLLPHESEIFHPQQIRTIVSPPPRAIAKLPTCDLQFAQFDVWLLLSTLPLSSQPRPTNSLEKKNKNSPLGVPAPCRTANLDL